MLLHPLSKGAQSSSSMAVEETGGDDGRTEGYRGDDFVGESDAAKTQKENLTFAD